MSYALQHSQQLHLRMQDAVQGVMQAAASAGASGHGKLDRSLKKLLLSVDAASSSDRSVASCKYWTDFFSISAT